MDNPKQRPNSDLDLSKLIQIIGTKMSETFAAEFLMGNTILTFQNK